MVHITPVQFSGMHFSNTGDFIKLHANADLDCGGALDVHWEGGEPDGDWDYRGTLTIERDGDLCVFNPGNRDYPVDLQGELTRIEKGLESFRFPFDVDTLKRFCHRMVNHPNSPFTAEEKKKVNGTVLKKPKWRLAADYSDAEDPPLVTFQYNKPSSQWLSNEDDKKILPLQTPFPQFRTHVKTVPVLEA